MFEGFCIACQYGMHDQHIEWPNKPLPGIYGGHHCPCEGECRKSKSERVQEFVDEMTAIYAAAHADEKEESDG